MVVLVKNRNTGSDATRDGAVGGRKNAGVGWIAQARELREGLLLHAVGGDGADLGQHILTRIEDAGAATQNRLAVAEDVIRKAEARLELRGLIGQIAG